MKRQLELLQRQLEAKERKMGELLKCTGGVAVPALKQHYVSGVAGAEVAVAGA